MSAVMSRRRFITFVAAAAGLPLLLNREGVLENAPDYFIAMLTRALLLAKISDGVYDPTIQPVWQTYFRHFTASSPDPAGPSPRNLAAALGPAGWRAA